MGLAAENLAPLTAFTQKGTEIQSVADAAASIEPDAASQAVPERDKDGKAKFALPEALVTFAVGTLLGGPIFGAFLGGAQGILKKKSDQSILDRMASEQNIFNDSADIYQDQIDSFKANAKNDDDLAQVGMMQAGLSVARNKMLSPDPATRAEADLWIEGLNGVMNKFASVNESQQIAADATAEAQRIALGDKRDSMVTGLKSSYDAASADYIKRSEAGNRAINALQGGSNTDIHTAVISYFKSIEPTSAVLGNEFIMLSNQGSRLEKIASWVNSEWNGEPMTVDQRRELAATIVGNQKESEKFQSAREVDYSNQLTDFEIPDRFHDQFRTIENMPTMPILNIPDGIPEKALNPAKTIIDTATDFALDNVDRMEDVKNFFKEEAPAFNQALSGGPSGRRPTN